ncbi:MAG: Endoglucanase [Paracidovorax wautersii]|uniref:cellulase n=1 Tax=Paracidovorax wautersii TaxID=1177982 RepID=A0A7V8FP50_9BURK|nr:MAG: Endoglucanase [Paracidovorax wautersii]
MVFALAANDPAAFDRIWRWAVANLAGGNMAARLPAWQWGRREDGSWGVIDPNAASDADLWLAYALLEASRVWNRPEYRASALALMARVQREEVVDLPGFGPMLLPGPTGFNLPGRVWRLNPSYLPVPLLRRLAAEDPKGPWSVLAANTRRLLEGAAVQGFVADWVGYRAPLVGAGGFVVDPVQGDVGSYDAIRCYLWAGMTAPGGMRQALAQSGGMPPEKVAVQTGQANGTGPLGFSAALLPYLRALGDDRLYQGQLRRVRSQLPEDGAGELPVYYDMVLSLFALGWVEGRYRFLPDGRLALPWAGAC